MSFYFKRIVKHHKKGIEFMQVIEVEGEYITLTQVLKLTNEFESGGEIKWYIRSEGVLVNGEIAYERGRKLYNNDRITLKHNGNSYVIRTEK